MSYTTRQSLLESMKRNENSAWEEFLDFYAPLIQMRAHDLRLTASETAELQQDICVNLFTRHGLANYDPTRKVRFRDYLRAIITNCAIDLLRRRTDPQPTLPAPSTTPEEEMQREQKEWHDFLMEKALDMIRRRCDPLNYMAFELHIQQERPVPEVAQALGISPARVSLACTRILRRLRNEIIRLEQELDR